MKIGTLYGNTNACAGLKVYTNLRNSIQLAAIFVTTCPNRCAKVIRKMRCKGAWTEAEKFKITQRLHNKVYILEIAKELGRDHCTIKKFAINPARCNGRSDKGKIWKQAPRSHRVINQIKREVCCNPLQSSKEVFESAGVPDVPKLTCCRILRKFGKCGKLKVRALLKDVHKKKMDWAKIT